MKVRHTKALLWHLGLVLLVALSFVPAAQAQSASQVDVLTVKGAITPIVAAYIDRGITTAEDTVLAKLEWYWLGGQASDRQWRDALGVLKVQGQRLDLAYMRHMAAGLGVQDLLERALEESV